jgi:hypothetical protein
MPQMRHRLLLSTMIGCASGLLCFSILSHLHAGAYDFRWALYPARELMAGRNPYAHFPPGAIGYPLTAVLLAAPFTKLSDPLAAGAFFGISSGLLALGLTRDGYHRLLIFLAYPYWAGLLTAQWIPLVMAGAFFPLLLPLTTTKPQNGLPIFLTHLSKRGTIACVVFVGITFLVMPSWFKDWLAQAVRYEHFIPILIFPGPLLLLALLRYRQRGAWLFLLTAMMPQRWFYDTFTLWLIPRSRRQILFTAIFSWGAGIWRWYHVPHSFHEVGRWSVIFLYLPMLVVLLLRPNAPARVAGEQEELGSVPNSTC